MLGNTLLMSGGRFRVGEHTSDVLLWVSTDGFGLSWQKFSLSWAHNTGVERGANVPAFTKLVNLSDTTGTGPRQTSAYTSLVKLDQRRFMVFYDQKLQLGTPRSQPPFHLNVTSYSMGVELAP